MIILMVKNQPSIKYVTDGARHLICVPYSIENLHVMAKELDLKRCWFHGGKKPHYDIPVRRLQEIETKCLIVRPRVLLDIIQGKDYEI